MSVPSSRVLPAEKMTLRRFVRVTYDNLRQLIQTIATPPNLPMPVLTTAPSEEPGNGKVPVPPVELVVGDAPVAERAPAEESTAGEDSAAGVDSTAVDRPVRDVGDTAVVDGQAGEDGAAGEDSTAGTKPALRVADTAVVDGQAAEDSAAAEDSMTATEPGPGVVEVAVEAEAAASAGQWPLLAGGQGLTLAGALESLLFVTDDPAEPARLARVLGAEPAVIEAALQELDAEYRQQGRGLRLQVRAGRYQIVTAPEAANLIEAYLNLDTSTKLSAPALETLAVIAYRQPVTRAQIEAVRGVDCSGVLRSLIQRGLIEEVGRVDAPGRPVLYGITDLFMHHFGLTALHELPPLESAELERIDEALSLDPLAGDGVSAAPAAARDATPGPA